MSEWLGSLQIIEKASSEYKQMDTEMSVAPAANSKNTQAGMPKNMVLDPG